MGEKTRVRMRNRSSSLQSAGMRGSDAHPSFFTHLSHLGPSGGDFKASRRNCIFLYCRYIVSFSLSWWCPMMSQLSGIISCQCCCRCWCCCDGVVHLSVLQTPSSQVRCLNRWLLLTTCCRTCLLIIFKQDVPTENILELLLELLLWFSGPWIWLFCSF